MEVKMKHCFIINPASGKSVTKEGLENKIREECSKREADCCILTTTARGDVQKYIRRFYDENRGEDIRFYACGGDGTLCEAVNGIMALEDREKVSLGVIPVGTGNDFVRNFTPKELFFDIGAQIDATSQVIDLIRCNQFYALNMINIGFDCQVVVKTDQVKRKKFVSSKLAYIIGLVWTLIKKPGVNVKVQTPEGEQHKALLLTTFANGRFCGGGFNSNPHAELCDGQINALFVNNVSRMKFLSLVGCYKNGTHLEGKYDDIVCESKQTEYSLCFDVPTLISVDGELYDAGTEAHISCEPSAISFLMPAGTVSDAVTQKIETLVVG